MIDFNALAIFCGIADAGSFTQASKQLNIPKSTLSRRLSQLEQRLGVKLIQRSTRQLMLTEAGLVYYQKCKRMVEEAVDAENMMVNMQSEPSGVLRIATPLAFGTRFFRQLLRDFRAAYPKVQLDILMHDQPLDLIAQKIDIAFRVGALNDSNLVARALGGSHWVFCATPDYIEKHAAPQSLPKLAQHALIYHPDSRLKLATNAHSSDKPATQSLTHSQDLLAQLIAQSQSHGIAVNDLDTVLKLTLDHMGIGLVHSIMIDEHLQSGALIPLLQNYPMNKLEVFMVYPGRNELPAKISMFRDFVMQRVTPTAPWEENLLQQ